MYKNLDFSIRVRKHDSPRSGQQLPPRECELGRGFCYPSKESAIPCPARNLELRDFTQHTTCVVLQQSGSFLILWTLFFVVAVDKGSLAATQTWHDLEKGEKGQLERET